MGYTPRPVPADVSELATYVYEELLQVSNIISIIEEGRILPVLHVAPKKPRDGMLAVADGTDWNPGGGKGIYERKGNVWTKL